MAHKTIIIYKSSTGFTEKYARLLAEKLEYVRTFDVIFMKKKP